MRFYTLFLLATFVAAPLCSHAKTPELLLANTYKPERNINLDNYWVSEKLDGVRAYWNGRTLMTRSGNTIKLPVDLKNTLPNTALDGELWLGRQSFEKMNAIIHSHKTPNPQWGNVQYKIFDLPEHKGTFNQRLIALNALHANNPNDFWSPITQFKVKTQNKLQQHLHDIEQSGGEGLMLHRGASLYSGTRSNDLLKVKSYQDAEAVVVGYTAGKGKHTGKTGALVVETENGIILNIGSGLSDYDRTAPPPIGSTITYKYFGLTHKGTPRFASYLRIRDTASSQIKHP